jgi:hypothetical protein
VRTDVTASNFGMVDTWLANVLAHNEEPMLVIFGASGPQTPSAASSLTTSAATHYLGKVHLYEFVNEPDLGGWTPQNYTAALQAAYVALKAVDPSAVMIAGSLWKWKDTAGYRTYDWVEQMYAAGAGGYFDMFSLHLYDDPDVRAPSWNIWDWAFYSTPDGKPNVRQVIDAHGDSAKPIIATEAGGPVSKYGETGQATIVDHDFNHLASGQIAMLLIYTMRNDVACCQSQGFGLLRDDLSRRPAWYTMQSHTV